MNTIIRSGPISRETIMSLAGKIKEGLPDVDVYLFGSYAYGKPNINSDVDMLVVYPDDTYENQKVDLIARHLTTSSGIPRDIMAVRRSRFEIACKRQTTLSYCVAHEGIKL